MLTTRLPQHPRTLHHYTFAIIIATIIWISCKNTNNRTSPNATSHETSKGIPPETSKAPNLSETAEDNQAVKSGVEDNLDQADIAFDKSVISITDSLSTPFDIDTTDSLSLASEETTRDWNEQLVEQKRIEENEVPFIMVLEEGLQALAEEIRRFREGSHDELD